MTQVPTTTEALAVVEQVGTISHKDGVLLKMCAMTVLYSLDMRPQDQKEAVLQIYDEYMALYDKSIRWTTNPKSGTWKRLKKGPADYAQPKDWLLEAKGEYEILYHGGEKKTDATDIVFYAAGKAGYHVDSNTLSQIHCRFPVQDIFEGKVDLPALMRRWSALLKPHHAHAGLGIGRSFGYENNPNSRDAETEMLLRMPGLQLWNVTEGLCFPERQEGLYYGPRCADWLISLSDSFLMALGGLEKVKETMGELPVHVYDGGAVLQAGAVPGLGSATLSLRLPYYEDLGRVIEPIRSKNLRAELCVAAPPDALSSIQCKAELSQQWHERFSPHIAMK